VVDDLQSVSSQCHYEMKIYKIKQSCPPENSQNITLLYNVFHYADIKRQQSEQKGKHCGVDVINFFIHQSKQEILSV
jgi:hypothetical protein